jgi:hypothetical protein
MRSFNTRRPLSPTYARVPFPTLVAATHKYLKQLMSSYQFTRQGLQGRANYPARAKPVLYTNSATGAGYMPTATSNYNTYGNLGFPGASSSEIQVRLPYQAAIGQQLTI